MAMGDVRVREHLIQGRPYVSVSIDGQLYGRPGPLALAVQEARVTAAFSQATAWLDREIADALWAASQQATALTQPPI